MHSKTNHTHKYVFLALILVVIFLGWKFLTREKRMLGLSAQANEITLIDNGMWQQIKTNSASIENFLTEQNIILNNQDIIYPEKNTRIVPGLKITIERIKKLSVEVDGAQKEITGFRESIEEILNENNIEFKEEDIIQPTRETFAYNDLNIKIIRVEIKEETEEESIAFKTVEKEDDELGWRVRKVTQKGAKGIKEIKYEVAYHDGDEVSRKIIDTAITKAPTEEIVTQGTYIKFGKSHTGLASWYAHTGTMAAANPWLPMGSYVKVTNKDNGKSVIVKINDRGPFGDNRIIDLDKVAFEQIASLGQGIANIKMEEIEN